MKKKIWIGAGIAASVILILCAFVFSKDYWISRQDSYCPYSGAADIYHASREELTALDVVQYSGMFGQVKNAKEASRIAAKVVKEIYGNDEYPYMVKFNENANAWIVQGSLLPVPLPVAGGVASVAIDADTGEILMLLHTK